MTPTQARLVAERKERLARIASRALVVEVAAAVEKDAEEDHRNEMTIRQAEAWLAKQLEAAPKTEPKQQFWFCIADRPGEASIQTIQRVVCDHYKVSMRDLLSPRRLAGIVFPRHVAFYLAKTMTKKSLPDIGRRFGGRDHTTILYGVRRITAMILADSALAAEVSALTETIAKLVGKDEADSHSPDRLAAQAAASSRQDRRAAPAG